MRLLYLETEGVSQNNRQSFVLAYVFVSDKVSW